LSLEQQADFKITTTWQDNASGPLLASTQKINLAWRRVRDEQRSVQRAFEINNRTLVATTRVIRSVTGVLRTAVSAYQTYTLMQIRSQDAARNLRDATQNLNEVLAEFGFGSMEYIKALQDMKDTADETARTTKDNLVGSLLLVADVLSSIFIGAVVAIPKVKQLLNLKKIPITKSPVKSPITSGGISSPSAGGAVGGKTVGGGPSVGGGGLGLIGPVAIAVTVMEAILGALGIKKQTGNSDIGFQRLENIQSSGAGQTTIIINASTSEEMIKAIEEASKTGQAFSVG